MTAEAAPDEAALVRRAASGDADAFSALVHLHHRGVYALALRLCGDADLAADVAQESFIRAWRGLGGFRGDAAFSTWLYRITVNTAWSWRKRAERQRVARLEEADAVVGTHHPSHPERRGEAVETAAKIDAALSRLPAASRTVVVLKDIHGWSHADIAAALGISVTAAKVRLHRAHLRLQAELDTLRLPS